MHSLTAYPLVLRGSLECQLELPAGHLVDCKAVQQTSSFQSRAQYGYRKTPRRASAYLQRGFGAERNRHLTEAPNNRKMSVGLQRWLLLLLSHLHVVGAGTHRVQV